MQLKKFAMDSAVSYRSGRSENMTITIDENGYEACLLHAAAIGVTLGRTTQEIVADIELVADRFEDLQRSQNLNEG